MRHLATRASWRRTSGFTLFEMAISAIIVALLAGVLLQRLRDYREQAELAAVGHLVGMLRTGLAIKTGQLRARNSEADALDLAGQNPLEWLSEKPPNYLGEYFSPEKSRLPKGHWYFDRKTKVLVYLLNNEKRFPQGTVNTLNFKVELIRLPSNPAKQNGTPGTTTVSLIQVNE